MSTSQSTRPKTERVAEYLRREVRVADGSLYVKSRYIAEELDLSAREIGAAIPRIDEQAHGLCIEKWSYSRGTTWRVSFDRATAAD